MFHYSDKIKHLKEVFILDCGFYLWLVSHVSIGWFYVKYHGRLAKLITSWVPGNRKSKKEESKGKTLPS